MLSSPLLLNGEKGRGSQIRLLSDQIDNGRTGRLGLYLDQIKNLAPFSTTCHDQGYERFAAALISIFRTYPIFPVVLYPTDRTIETERGCKALTQPMSASLHKSGRGLASWGKMASYRRATGGYHLAKYDFPLAYANLFSPVTPAHDTSSFAFIS